MSLSDIFQVIMSQKCFNFFFKEGKKEKNAWVIEGLVTLMHVGTRGSGWEMTPNGNVKTPICIWGFIQFCFSLTLKQCSSMANNFV